MFRWLFVLLALVMSAGCVVPGPVVEKSLISADRGTPILNFGIVADSQLQSFDAWANRNVYRFAGVDKHVKVTLRPPVLDYASRDLLVEHLRLIKQSRPRAIFFLGDLANHGCSEEFGNWPSKASSKRTRAPLRDLQQMGVLDILARERSAQTPIFVVIGNHDFLGAGSTSTAGIRKKLCAGAPLSKLDVMRRFDAFNRESASMAAGWKYQSNFNEGAAAANCVGPRPHRQAGCFLSAAVDYRVADSNARFMLLDTNDYSNVSHWLGIVPVQMEGERGGISFYPEQGSQTNWFHTLNLSPADVTVALAHYDLAGLSKHVANHRINRVVGRFGDMFPAQSDRPLFLISGHIHSPQNQVFRPSYLGRAGETEAAPIHELNIGSTTDNPSLSALIEINRSGEGDYSLTYRNVSPSRAACGPVLEELDGAKLPEVAAGTTPRRALLIDPATFTEYRTIDKAALGRLFANLDSFIGLDSNVPQSHLRAVCLGLLASRMEAEIK